MSDIKAGDLVMVVKPIHCCGGTASIGLVFVVQEVAIAGGKCGGCYVQHPPMPVAFINDWFRYDLHRLIKIDPPALPSTEREKELVLR
jgi:hypothetical protein